MEWGAKPGDGKTQEEAAQPGGWEVGVGQEAEGRSDCHFGGSLVGEGGEVEGGYRGLASGKDSVSSPDGRPGVRFGPMLLDQGSHKQWAFGAVGFNTQVRSPEACDTW